MAARPLAFPKSWRWIPVELIVRQGTLAMYGMIVLGLSAVALILQILDPRLLESGVNVWVKPAKFLSSIGIFALTAAWFFGYVRPERRMSGPARAAVAMLLIGGTFELLWIGWQGANGLESHFNNSTPFYSIMYALMGLFAVVLVGSTLPLAWEIGRRPAQHLRSDFVAGRAHPSCHRCDLFLRENARLHAALDQRGQAGGAVGELHAGPAASS